MRPVDVDDVEATVAGAQARRHPLVLNPADVGRLHLLTHQVRVEVGGQLGGAHRREARDVVRSVRAPVVQLETGQGAVPVRRVRHQTQRAHVGLVPESSGDERRLVRLG